MICDACKRDGTTSTIEIGVSKEKTDRWNPPFFDENGRKHDHDPNWITTKYRCSRGHEWVRTWQRPCWCGWPEGKVREVRAFESETLTALQQLEQKARRLGLGMSAGPGAHVLEIASELDTILNQTSELWDQIESIGGRMLAHSIKRAKANRDKASEVVVSFLDQVEARGDAVAAYARMVDTIANALAEAQCHLELHRPIIVHALEELLATDPDEEKGQAASAALAVLLR